MRTRYSGDRVVTVAVCRPCSSVVTNCYSADTSAAIGIGYLAGSHTNLPQGSVVSGAADSGQDNGSSAYWACVTSFTEREECEPVTVVTE